LKAILVFLLGGMLLVSTSVFAGSVYSSGEIDEDLRFENFQISGGYLTGSIVNASKRTRSAVKLDMWTCNTQETRIYWRKTVDLGDLAPGAKAAIKEPYKVDQEDLARTKFMFRPSNPANFRNQPTQPAQAGQATPSKQQKQQKQQKQKN